MGKFTYKRSYWLTAEDKVLCPATYQTCPMMAKYMAKRPSWRLSVVLWLWFQMLLRCFRGGVGSGHQKTEDVRSNCVTLLENNNQADENEPVNQLVHIDGVTTASHPLCPSTTWRSVTLVLGSPSWLPCKYKILCVTSCWLRENRVNSPTVKIWQRETGVLTPPPLFSCAN